MTQIKQGLFKSPAYTHVVTSAEDNGLSKDKSPSPELFEMNTGFRKVLLQTSPYPC